MRLAETVRVVRKGLRREKGLSRLSQTRTEDERLRRAVEDGLQDVHDATNENEGRAVEFSTFADLPSASSVRGRIFFVDPPHNGRNLFYSDGTQFWGLDRVAP